MAVSTHRYWRVANLVSWGTALELSEFHLFFQKSRVDAAATLTSSVAPTTGSLANLKDNSLATSARWSSVAGLTLQWDFGGSPADVDDVQLGALAEDSFLAECALQWSNDGTNWYFGAQFGRIVWPGNGAKTTSLSIGLWNYRSTAGAASEMFFRPDRRIAVITDPSTSDSGIVGHNTPRSSGVLQFEFVATLFSGLTGQIINYGVMVDTLVNSSLGSATGTWSWRTNHTSQSQSAAQGTVASYGSAPGYGDTIGIVIDFTSGTMTGYKNGVSQGVIATGFNGRSVVPAVGVNSANSSQTEVLLRTDVFAYPIAGASPWMPGARIAVAPTIAEPPVLFVNTPGATPAYGGGYERDWSTVGRYNFFTGGTGRVRGTVKEKSTPSNISLRRKVRLIRERDGLLVRETWSDAATGNYDFQDVELNETYTVLAYDYQHNYRAVVADNLSLANAQVEVMP